MPDIRHNTNKRRSVVQEEDVGGETGKAAGGKAVAEGLVEGAVGMNSDLDDMAGKGSRSDSTGGAHEGSTDFVGTGLKTRYDAKTGRLVTESRLKNLLKTAKAMDQHEARLGSTSGAKDATGRQDDDVDMERAASPTKTAPETKPFPFRTDEGLSAVDKVKPNRPVQANEGRRIGTARTIAEGEYLPFLRTSPNPLPHFDDSGKRHQGKAPLFHDFPAPQANQLYMFPPLHPYPDSSPFDPTWLDHEKQTGRWRKSRLSRKGIKEGEQESSGEDEAEGEAQERDGGRTVRDGNGNEGE